MKHIKEFETKKDDQVDILRDLLMENPLYEDNDFYLFIGRDEFKETENGMYKKVLDIENMVKITPDIQSIGAMKGLEMRARFQSESNLYHIWLPKELEEYVSGKSSQRIPSWLIDLIDKHKMKGVTTEGKKKYKDVLDRRKNIGKFNL